MHIPCVCAGSGSGTTGASGSFLLKQHLRACSVAHRREAATVVALAKQKVVQRKGGRVAQAQDAIFTNQTALDTNTHTSTTPTKPLKRKKTELKRLADQAKATQLELQALALRALEFERAKAAAAAATTTIARLVDAPHLLFEPAVLLEPSAAAAKGGQAAPRTPSPDAIDFAVSARRLKGWPALQQRWPTWPNLLVVSAVLINKENQVLLARRKTGAFKNQYEFPGAWVGGQGRL
jgi:hypothetical protein